MNYKKQLRELNHSTQLAREKILVQENSITDLMIKKSRIDHKVKAGAQKDYMSNHGLAQNAFAVIQILTKLVCEYLDLDHMRSVYTLINVAVFDPQSTSSSRVTPVLVKNLRLILAKANEIFQD